MGRPTVSESSGGMGFYSIKMFKPTPSSDFHAQLNQMDNVIGSTENNKNIELSGKILAFRPDSYEHNNDTKHKYCLFLDVSEDGEPDVIKVEFNFNGLGKGFVNALANMAEQRQGLLQGSLLYIRVYQNSKTGWPSMYLELDGSKDDTGWLYTDKKMLEKIKDMPEQWVGLWKKHIKPHLPEEYKANESAMAGVAEAKNNVGPVEDDSVDPLPF